MNKLLLLTAVFLAFGCIKSKDDEVVKVGKVPSEFFGTWDGCFVDGSDSIKIRQMISENSVVHSETFYENDTTCTSGSAIVNIESSNALTKQSPLTFKMSTTSMTPMTPAMATSFNNSFICFYQQWSSGSSHDVTGWDCTNDLDFSDFTPFEVYYSRSGNTLTVDDGEGSQFSLTRVP